MFKFAACQLLVVDDKQENLNRARKLIREAASNGAKVVSLPEIFNCPYGHKSFLEHWEDFNKDSISYKMLQEEALHNKIYLIGGSVPEKDGDKIYNTSLAFGPDGQLLAKHRKVHLFDINVPGKITFKESDTLSAGQDITVFDTEFCKIGLAICYDIRFPELALQMAAQGCKFLVYPAAFNLTTGPAHWELLQRARALDNQLYVAAISPARTPGAGYQAYGHSSIISPWGEVLATTEHDEAIIYANIDLARVDEVRASIPIYQQKRKDLYHVY